MRKDTGTRQGATYKVKTEVDALHREEVGGGYSTADRKDSITLQEGRSPALTGAYSDWEGPVTAKGQTPLAQRTEKKVRVLQNKLHQAAKKDLSRTFGILYDKICSWEVLWISWIRVQRNKGAPGVDGRTIKAIKEDGEVQFLRDIQKELLEKRYHPQPIRRVFIRKANGKLRPLGIPIVKDRVVQGAVKLILEPIFEANFTEESYGFRPGRGCQDALRSIRKWVTYGYSAVVDADIASYFDTIDHDLLMKLVQRRVRDKWVLRLIRRWLKCSIFEQDKAVLAEKGTPQGAVLSPLLANIYLHPLDKYWRQRHPETKLVRYADDLVVLVRRRDPVVYLQSLDTFMRKLHLRLSEEKTRIVRAEEGFDFLGALLILKPTRRDRTRRFCYGFPSPKSMNRVRQKLRETIGKDYDCSLEDKIELVNPILRGWANYFNWLNSGEHFHKVGRYVIQRLNRWQRRKQGRVRRSYRKLHGNDLYQRGLYRITGTIAYVY
jgi:RNA-directed DNA polymerase